MTSERTASYYPATVVTLAAKPGAGAQVVCDGDEVTISAVNAAGRYLAIGSRVLVEFVQGAAIIFGVLSDPAPWRNFTPTIRSGTIAGAVLGLSGFVDGNCVFRNDDGLITATGGVVFDGTGHTLNDQIVFVTPSNFDSVLFVGGTWLFLNASNSDDYNGVFVGVAAADNHVSMRAGGSSFAQYGAGGNTLELGQLLNQDVTESVGSGDILRFWLQYRGTPTG